MIDTSGYIMIACALSAVLLTAMGAVSSVIGVTTKSDQATTLSKQLFLAGISFIVASTVIYFLRLPYL